MAKQAVRSRSTGIAIALMILYSFGTISVCADTQPGKKPAPPQAVNRIVSMAPSNTELIYDLGAEDKLIGVSEYSDYPPAAKSKPRVGNLVLLNMEKLANLNPQAIVFVSGQEAMSQMAQQKGFKTIVLANDHLDQIAGNLRALGSLTGKSAQANKLAASFEDSLKALSQILSSAKTKPRVLFCVWPEPLLTVGGKSFLNDVITACGGTNVTGAIPVAYPHYNLEKLMFANADIIILPYESKDSHIEIKPPWSSLAAVKQGKLYYLPSREKDCLSRPTLRIVNGLYWLTVKIHPELSSQLKIWLDKYSPQLN